MAKPSPPSPATARPPVVLLVTEPDQPQPALEDALGRAGVVLVNADPDAAPGFLEASDWPGVQVTTPELVVVLGAGADGLARRLRARGFRQPVLAQANLLPPEDVGGFVARVLAHLRRDTPPPEKR
jgi:hypothetical protein